MSRKPKSPNYRIEALFGHSQNSPIVVLTSVFFSNNSNSEHLHHQLTVRSKDDLGGYGSSLNLIHQGIFVLLPSSHLIAMMIDIYSHVHIK